MTEQRKGKSEYDLGKAESLQFSEIYSDMLNLAWRSYSESDKNITKKYVASMKVVSQYLKHYMTDQESTELAQNTEKKAKRQLKRLKQNKDPRKLEQIHDNVEKLRHKAGLKLPQETKIDPETVGVDQL